MLVAIEVPFYSLCFFSGNSQVGTSKTPAFIRFLCPSVENQAERQETMKLKIRYENEFQTIELDAKATEEMWVSLSLGCDEDITQEEKEKLIQDAWNEQYNKPEYNNWHKFDRHRGFSKAKPNDETDEIDSFEPLMSEVKDSSIFCKDEHSRINKYEYEALTELLHKILKSENAEMVIAIAVKGYSDSEYASMIGDSANNVSHRYRRALRKLKKYI